MSITYQDYKYIYNSFADVKSKQDSEELKIGSVVKNLVVDLNQENIYNPTFNSYYGDKKLSESWSVVGLSNYTETVEIDPNPEKIEIGEYGGSCRGQTSGSIYIKITDPILSFVEVEDIDIDSINIFNKTNVASISSRLDKDNKQWIFDVYNPSQGANVSFSYTYKTIAYNCTGETTWSSSENIKISKITSITGDYISEAINNNNQVTIKWSTIVAKNNLPQFKFSAIIEYVGSAETALSQSIQQGLLLHSVTLEPRTSYVLQVIGATKPKSQELEQNKIIDSSENNLFLFNQYLFFQTSDDINYILQINGISFGYKTYNLIKTETEISCTQIRSFESPIQAKVFLFKSDLPWIVDKNGVIVGLNDCPLQSSLSENSEGVSAKLTEEEIKNIFSKTPKLTLLENESGNQLALQLSDWKYKDLWAYTKDSDNYPNIMNNLKILTYRNYLTEIVENNQLQQFKEINHIENYKTLPIPLTEYIEEASGSTLNVPLNIGSFTSETMSLEFLPLLEPNIAYCKQRGLVAEKEKYTSVSFAWGYEEKGNYIRLSPFSIPLIVNRELKDDLVLKNNEFVEKESCNYYKQKAIYWEIIKE